MYPGAALARGLDHGAATPPGRRPRNAGRRLARARRVRCDSLRLTAAQARANVLACLMNSARRPARWIARLRQKAPWPRKLVTRSPAIHTCPAPRSSRSGWRAGAIAPPSGNSRRVSGPLRGRLSAPPQGQSRDKPRRIYCLFSVVYLVRVAGLEPARGCPRLILSQMRLPFRHTRDHRGIAWPVEGIKTGKK